MDYFFANFGKIETKMTGTIPLKKQNMDKAVIDLIYDKQLEFTKEKGRKVSLEQTVNRMIKEVYLKPMNNGKEK